jgi:uncharacterized membrane protein YdjX (TVP38/TMEM64 family)
MSRTLRFWLGLGLPLALVLAYALVSPVREGVNRGMELLTRLDVEQVKETIRGLGAWGPLLSFSLMILQSLAAPIPAFLITFANAAVYGWFWGGLLSFTSALAGAALCFGLARFYGRTWVSRITGKGVLAQVDGFFARQGGKAILVARLLPFMPFDVVSFGAGLTPMGFLAFLGATALGQLPATLLYSWSGDFFTGNTRVLVYSLLGVFAVAGIIWIIKSATKTRKETLTHESEIP